MGCSGGKVKATPGRTLLPQIPRPSSPVLPFKEGEDEVANPSWTKETADLLQASVDRIFGNAGKSLLGLEFSFTVADPSIDGCPLVGCSTGFTKLCGYEMHDIVGRNCRFLVDPVPLEHIDKQMKRHVGDFCKAVALNQEYIRPTDELEPWMPVGRPSDELVAMQMNSRKDGSLFHNMFYMKVFDVGSELGQEKPYIVALQTELAGGKTDLAQVVDNLAKLDAKMDKVKAELTSMFFVQSSLSRKAPSSSVSSKESPSSASTCATLRADFGALDAGSSPGGFNAPAELHTSFPSEEVQTWPKGRFRLVRKLADASRNCGVMNLMEDTQQNNEMVAVKQMPNSWIRECHEEFLRNHPGETEMPWGDIGCTRLLNSAGSRYACNLQGVFRSDADTFVVSSFASEGDLFNLALSGETPGPKRESALAPLMVQFMDALQHLHDMQIVHRDISLENILQTIGKDGKPSIKVCDYGMASTERMFENAPRGKASCVAPEMRSKGQYDAFLSDTFAAGVVLYACLLRGYPWQSTKPGACKCYEYVQDNGLPAYCAERCLRGGTDKVIKCLSKPLLQLLTGMLMFDPDSRLTLGEKQWTNEVETPGKTRRSVWDETWLRNARQGLLA